MRGADKTWHVLGQPLTACLNGASWPQREKGGLSRGLLNGTAGKEEHTKAWGARRAENLRVSRFRTQRAVQPWQVRPSRASAFCPGLGSRSFPVCTDGQQPHPWIQCWPKTLRGWPGLYRLMGSPVEGRPGDC